MNDKIRNPVRMLLFLALALFITSCSSKFNEYINVLDDNRDKIAGGSSKETEPLVYSVQAVPENEAPRKPSLLEKEISSLRMVLAPYMNSFDPSYIGDENSEFITSALLNTKEEKEPMPIEDWERAVRILLRFEAEDEQWIRMYITDFSNKGFIERQHAVFGFMNLLSARYPLSLGGIVERLQRAEIITDLDTIDDKHQELIRQAYCLGLTDFSVETDRLFRPCEPLSRAEAVSMFYRVFLNYGLPKDTEHEESLTGQHREDDEKSDDDQISEAFSKEDIQKEYGAYIDNLNKKGEKGKKKIEMLKQAEKIINFGLYTDDPVELKSWEQVLCEVFGLNREIVSPYLFHDAGNVLTYDVAAISIFKLSHLFGGYDARDASETEINMARDAIPQFETARDMSKLAQMFTSGLLDGLYQIPGFTPQRPVNKAEAILLVKRMVESLP